MSQQKEIIFYATPLKKMNGWEQNSTYQVFVSKLWNKRLAIYKQSPVDKESGYRLYESLEELEKDFSIERKLITVNY